MSKENSNSEESNLQESEPVVGSAALDLDETADLKNTREKFRRLRLRGAQLQENRIGS